MTKFENIQAVAELEKLQATHGEDNEYTINIWNFDTNTCEHFTVTRQMDGSVEIPDRVFTLWNDTRLQNWITGK